MFNEVVYDTDNIIENYENDKIIILENFINEGNIKYLRERPSFPVGTKNKWKKTKFETVIKPNYIYKFAKNNKFFIEQFNKLINLVDKFVKSNFSIYDIVGTNHTFRMAKTRKEEVHFDVFDPHKVHHLRIFINFDYENRIWNSSHTWDYYLNKCEKRKELNSARSLNKYINKKFLDHKNPEVQTIAFKPFTMWICNSETVSHEIVYGNRCLAFSYLIHINSMRDPRKAFIRRFLKWYKTK